MNLIIDSGNTLHKLAVYHKGEEIYFITSNELSLNLFEDIYTRHSQIINCIYCSVSKPSEIPASFCKNNNISFIELNEHTELPFINLYENPEKLGKDRIAVVAGALNKYPEKNCLIIDCGTAITYDIITSDKKYVGGNISPGINLRYKALSHFTNRLPLLNITMEYATPGLNTENAISSGVQEGALHEIDGFINYFKKYYDDLNVLLTGGDASVFDKKLKNTIFVVPKLLRIGLNFILDYNVQKT